MLKWGNNATTKGNFRVGKKTVESLNSVQRQAGFDEVVLDFEHNTVPNHPSNKGEPAQIAARGEPLVVEGEGLYFDNLEWTEPGKTHREHYHDLSAVVARDENEDVIFVHSGALCRNGATYDLHAFNARLDAKTFALTPYTDPSAPVRAISQTQINVDLLRKVLSLSNLSADATIEDINKALEDFAAQSDSSVSDQGENALSADGLKGIAIALATLTAEVKDIRDGQAAAERNQIKADAIRDGKIVPKEIFGNANISNADLKALVAELPEIVPMDQRTPESIEALTPIRLVNSADEQVRKNMGIPLEVWKKHAA